MLRRLATVLAVMALAGCGGVSPPEQKTSWRINEIRICGNFVTPERYIRSCLQFYPGQAYHPGDLIASQMLLALAGIEADIIVRAPEDESPFRNVDIWVRETPLQHLVFRRAPDIP